MEATSTSETLVNSYQTTQRYKPEYSHLHGNQNNYGNQGILGIPYAEIPHPVPTARRNARKDPLLLTDLHVDEF
jgi:hypothetical protein